MSSEKRHIDDFLRSVFRSHDTGSAAGGWDDFNAVFQARRKKKRRRGFMFFSLAILLASAAVWLSTGHDEKPVSVPAAAADPVNNDTKSGQPAKIRADNAEWETTHTENQGISQPASANSASSADGANTTPAKAVAETETAQSAGTQANQHITRSSPGKSTGAQAQLKEPLTQGTGTIADEMPSITPRAFITFAQVQVKPESLQPVSISPPDFAKLKLKKLPSFIVPGLQLVFMVSPAVTYNHYSNTADNKVHKDLQSNLEASIKPKTTVNFGLNLRYNVKNLSFGTGMEYYSLGQSGHYSYTISEAPVYDIDGSIAGYLTLSDTFKKTQNSSASTSFTYVQMPVSVGYAFPLPGHARIILSGGGNLQYKLAEKGLVPNAQSMEMTKAGEEQKSNKINGSVMMALGFQCRLNRRFDLELATRFSQQLRPQYDKNSLYNNRINTIGLNIGLIYNLIP